jgi:hypothetical protein
MKLPISRPLIQPVALLTAATILTLLSQGWRVALIPAALLALLMGFTAAVSRLPGSAMKQAVLAMKIATLLGALAATICGGAFLLFAWRERHSTDPSLVAFLVIIGTMALVVAANAWRILLQLLASPPFPPDPVNGEADD